MALHLSHKTSTTPGKAPLPADLERGEIAVNLADRRLYTKDQNDVVVELGGSGVAISDAAPTSAAPGTLWWKSDTGQMYVRYKDADTEQWVSVAGANGKDGKPGQTIIASDTAPASPNVNDIWWHTGNGNLYLYYDDGNSKQWVSVGGPIGQKGNIGPPGPGITTAATAPASPSVNALWFNTINGKLYLYHDDGNTRQWIALT